MPPSVLLIDDDPTFRALARRVLTRAGLDVVGEADCIAAARTQATALRPELVVLDVGLPDGDGVVFARELAALDHRPKVLITSVDADATSDEDARATGALGFVPKHELPGAGLTLLTT